MLLFLYTWIITFIYIYMYVYINIIYIYIIACKYTNISFNHSCAHVLDDISSKRRWDLTWASGGSTPWCLLVPALMSSLATRKSRRRPKGNPMHKRLWLGKLRWWAPRCLRSWHGRPKSKMPLQCFLPLHSYIYTYACYFIFCEQGILKTINVGKYSWHRCAFRKALGPRLWRRDSLLS